MDLLLIQSIANFLVVPVALFVELDDHEFLLYLLGDQPVHLAQADVWKEVAPIAVKVK